MLGVHLLDPSHTLSALVVAALDGDVDGISGEGPLGIDADLAWLAGGHAKRRPRRRPQLTNCRAVRMPVWLAAVPGYVPRYSIDQQIAGCCFLKVSCGLRARSRITPAESRPKTGVV
jgi:hypothetical protein